MVDPHPFKWFTLSNEQGVIKEITKLNGWRFGIIVPGDIDDPEAFFHIAESIERHPYTDSGKGTWKYDEVIIYNYASSDLTIEEKAKIFTDSFYELFGRRDFPYIDAYGVGFGGDIVLHAVNSDEALGKIFQHILHIHAPPQPQSST